MDIALMSTAYSSMKVQDAASIAVLKKAMDTEQQFSQGLNNMLQTSAKSMEISVSPNLGSNVDVRV